MNIKLNKIFQEGTQKEIITFLKTFLKKNNINNPINSDKDTLLHFAMHTSKQEVGLFLLKNKNININIQNSDLETPLHIAIKRTLTDIVDFYHLNPQLKPNLNLKDKYGNTPIHLMISKTENKVINKNLEKFESIAEKLIDQNKDFNYNTLDNSNISLVYLCVRFKCPNLLKYLLTKKDINYDVKNKYNFSPLSLAIHDRNIQEMIILSEYIFKKQKIKTNGQFIAIKGLTNKNIKDIESIFKKIGDIKYIIENDSIVISSFGKTYKSFVILKSIRNNKFKPNDIKSIFNNASVSNSFKKPDKQFIELFFEEISKNFSKLTNKEKNQILSELI